MPLGFPVTANNIDNHEKNLCRDLPCTRIFGLREIKQRGQKYAKIFRKYVGFVKVREGAAHTFGHFGPPPHLVA